MTANDRYLAADKLGTAACLRYCAAVTHRMDDAEIARRLAEFRELHAASLALWPAAQEERLVADREWLGIPFPRYPTT